MTQLLTSAQMRALEQATIDSGAVTGQELMERAGRGVLGAVFRWRRILQQAPHRAVVLCGPGNNGGDGYVIARLLRALHWKVSVLSLGPPKTPDARAMAALWTGDVTPLTRATFREVEGADLYIDAIFGTGLARAPAGDLGALLREIAAQASFFCEKWVAVDAPSGLCLDSGRGLGGVDGVPSAGLTVTFESPKVGHFLDIGPARCGALEVVDLGLGAGHAAAPGVQLTERPFDFSYEKSGGHKFDHGHALIVSGGFGRTGAARLAARAALRIGAGVVSIAAPGSALMECAAQLTAIMLRRCDDAAGLNDLLADRRITAVCIGPGLGVDERHRELVATVLSSGRSAVLDADAITLISNDNALRAKLHPGCTLTPHMGEFARLCPDLAQALQPPELPLTGPAFSKVDAAREAASRLGCGIVLKGADTVFASPDGTAHVHSCAYERAAPWLATAGAGDVLAGMITGRLAMAPRDGAALVPFAIWLHAEAARSFGPGLIAEDLPEELPKVLRTLSGD